MFREIDTSHIRGYQPRKLNLYEQQIENEWKAGNVNAVLDLVEGWVRTITTETDLKQQVIDQHIEEISEHMNRRFGDDISPFAAVDEIRMEMAEKGLTP